MRKVLAASALLVLSLAEAQPLNVNGLYMGMSTWDAKSQMKALEEFSVGGVKAYGMLNGPFLTYLHMRLHKLQFLVSTADFEKMVGAVRLHYPEMKCSDEEIRLAGGQMMQQSTCVVEDEDSHLRILRHATQEIASLTLVSKRELEYEGIDKATPGRSSKGR